VRVRPRRAAASAAASLVVAGLAVLAPAPAYADGDACDSINAPDTRVDQRPDPSGPVRDLQIEDLQEQLPGGRAPGEGAVVAVLDSGIAGGFAQMAGSTPPREITDWHGTAMAGVIAGPQDGSRVIGFAPAAELVDVRVYDSLQADDEEVGLSADGVAAGLQWLVDNHGSLGTDIAVVPLPVARTDAMDAAIDRLDQLDVIVVAASGDRPSQETDPLYDEYGGEVDEGSDGPPPGEDAAKDSWPAGYDNGNVVAVATAAPDGASSADIVLRNQAIDVAAPTLDLVGYGMNGAPCVVPHSGAQSLAPGSAWAAAEVAGVLALLETAYAGETAEQLLARLYATATGTASVTQNNVLTGHGIIQPLEALRRPLRPAKNGALPTSEVRDRDNVPVAVPESEPDLLASTRDNAIWWGLLGGGALLVAMVLRPVLTRRNR
jgi:membrane-anchored mycosin MYCP